MDETKLISDECTLDDVVSAYKEVSEELEIFGVPAFPENEYSQESKLSVNEFTILLKSLINASHYMLYRHRKTLREYEELELKRMRDLDDNHVLKNTVERLKRELQEKDSALSKSEDNVKLLKEKFSKKEVEYKIQCEEIRTVRCQMKYNEKKTVHDLKKKDVQINKLQLQLDRTMGIRPVNRVKPSPPTKEVKTSKDFADKEEAYQQIICKFEVNNKGLILENQLIFKALCKLNEDLASLVDHYNAVLCNPVNETEEERKMKENQNSGEEQMSSHTNLSPEECIASSNKHIESLNILINSFKEKHE